jgi:hypothetical protein
MKSRNGLKHAAQTLPKVKLVNRDAADTLLRRSKRDLIRRHNLGNTSAIIGRHGGMSKRGTRDIRRLYNGASAIAGIRIWAPTNRFQLN